MILLIASASIPLILSFDKKVRFYKHWKYIFPSVLLTSALFIFIDIIFTEMGVWGFNPLYHSGIILAGLPLEEWLFFILIPYASLFIHYVFVSYLPDLQVSRKYVLLVSGLLITLLVIVIIFNTDRIYTLVYSLLAILLLLVSLIIKKGIINRYLISFPIILVPFLIVNGILTGTFIVDEVVWYNNDDIIGIRLLTIPIEDIGYTFTLILMNLLLISLFEKIFGKRTEPGFNKLKIG